VPELPEVETIRVQLEPLLCGRRIEGVEIRDPRLTRPFDPGDVARDLEGERIAELSRRGKYLILRFESGRSLLMHLRMTGNLRIGPAGSAADDPHERAVVRLDDGSEVAYRDVRRLGTWLLVEPDELAPYLAERVGAEPLESSFRARALAVGLAGRRAPIKAALLDQRTLAGLGNIYADEALWRARVHPLRPAGELDPSEIARLHRGIRDTLRAGIARQGATLRDYARPDGEPGAMQEEFKVYGRAGEPCLRCGTPIEQIRAAGRGTSYCPRCQSLESAPTARPSRYAAISSSRPRLSRRQSSS
jgi:formamidopyrimidine-DNA glycosylase